MFLLYAASRGITKYCGDAFGWNANLARRPQRVWRGYGLVGPASDKQALGDLASRSGLVRARAPERARARPCCQHRQRQSKVMNPDEFQPLARGLLTDGGQECLPLH
jgi:hypothetical protein